MASEIEIGPVERAFLCNDITALSEGERAALVLARCEALGIDPRLSPLAYTKIDGRVVLYANKGCAEQLCSNRKLTVEIVEHGHDNEGLYYARSRVTRPDGTFVDEMGFVALTDKDGKRLSGTRLANAKLTAITKAKRRGILMACAANTLDETEVRDAIDSLEGARKHAAVETKRAEKSLPAPAPKAADRPKVEEDKESADKKEFWAWLRSLCPNRERKAELVAHLLNELGIVVGDQEDPLSPILVRKLFEEWVLATGPICDEAAAYARKWREVEAPRGESCVPLGDWIAPERPGAYSRNGAH